jgi:hypothetical protein
MKRFIYVTIVSILFSSALFADEIKTNSNKHHISVAQSYYDSAYKEIELMLNDSIESSFIRAVFVTENAYLDNSLSYDKYNEQIDFLHSLAQLFNASNELLYSQKDKEQVEKLGAIFYLMTDTIDIIINNQLHYHAPFKYNFDDIWGEKDWSNMFVSSLMTNYEGNCHSLPFLYKILADKMEAEAHLAIAPNHFYIKSKCKKGGWYNTELTSATFPIDAWIMASGYISVQAVQNRLYMDTLSQKQALAICMTDLAQGYVKRFGTDADLDFILQCTNQALNNYPNYVNALLLEAETLKDKFEQLTISAKYDEETKIEAKNTFDKMEAAYVNIHELGYRTMPKEMYMQWLMELNQEKDKYLNKRIITNFQSK